MTNSAGSFFIELSSIFDPQGFKEAQKEINQSSQEFSKYYNNLNNQTDKWSSNFISGANKINVLSSASLNSFFDSASKNFLDLENLAKGVFKNILSSFLSMGAQMATQSFFGAIFGGGTSLFGSLLGSRRTGGAINQTGPYLLHEGEYVLSPEAAKAQETPTITINSPITINAQTSSSTNAKELCEQIAQAARKGVSWAVEQAKISYKIGKQKDREASL